MDGQTDRWTDRRLYEQMDGIWADWRMDGRTARQCAVPKYNRSVALIVEQAS